MTAAETRTYWYILTRPHTLPNGVMYKVWQGEDRGDYVIMTKEPGSSMSFGSSFHCSKAEFFKTLNSYLKDYRGVDYSKPRAVSDSISEMAKKIKKNQEQLDMLIKLVAGQWKV